MVPNCLSLDSSVDFRWVVFGPLIAVVSIVIALFRRTVEFGFDSDTLALTSPANDSVGYRLKHLDCVRLSTVAALNFRVSVLDTMNCNTTKYN